MGEFVRRDETVANIETDKVTIPVNSPESGLLLKVFAQPGDTVQVGSDLFTLDLDKAPPPPPSTGASAKDEAKPSVSSTEGGESAKKDLKKAESKAQTSTPIGSALFIDTEPPKASTPTAKSSRPALFPTQQPPSSVPASFVRAETREKLTRMRMRIAERMKEAQNMAASLTTFNEIDMSTFTNFRNAFKDDFFKRHGVKLGFMSLFVKASACALKEMPVINARIDGEDIVYHDYADISVAVATPKGLVTPVLRDCDRMSMVQIERAIAELGERARDNKISIEELTGGTFTISNGGVFGSMMGTPILNPPQSAILGMHAIKERAMVVNGSVEIRPMMYVALTYDHRLIDGREAVSFLVRLKQLIEEPLRFVIDY